MQSLAERALCVIESRLKSIRTQDGYNTDSGMGVFRARASLAMNELPAVVVWDGGEQPDGIVQSTSFKNLLLVNINACAEANQDSTGRVLERLKADTKRALLGPGCGIEDEGGKIGALAYTGAHPFPREDGAQVEIITMNFQILMMENVGDPTGNS